jgi:hypothetical protein
VAGDPRETPYLAATGERIGLENGAELLLDDRMRDIPPGWFLRHPGADPRAVDVDTALRLAGPLLARHVTSLTMALICELHVRSIAPATFDDETSSDELRHAKFRLVKQVADAVHRLARTSDS